MKATLTNTDDDVSIYAPNEMESYFKFTVTVNDLNMQNQLFGGQLLYWMDAKVGECMLSLVKGAAVTAHISEVHFYSPACLDDSLEMKIKPIYSGSSSVEWLVEVFNETKEEVMATAYFTMVYLGKTMPKHNKKALLPIKIVPKTDTEIAMYNHIKALRERCLHKTNTF